MTIKDSQGRLYNPTVFQRTIDGSGLDSADDPDSCERVKLG